jgi:hypothetical protein
LIALGAVLILESAGIVRAMLLMAPVLCLPVVFNVFHDFCSECAMAALLFAGCCVAMRSASEQKYSCRLAVVAGVLFAFALGIKPARFMYVLGVAACCSAVGVVAALAKKISPISHTAACIGLLWVENFSRVRQLLKAGGRLYLFEHNPWTPLTQVVVRMAEIDRNAVLLSAPTARRCMREAGFTGMRTEYLMFAPPRLGFARGVDDLLRKVPMAAQYVVEAV